MYKVKFWTVKKIIAGMLLTIIGMIVGLTYDANAAQVSAFQIDFIDVGQGDAMLVSCDGHHMLVDGGDAAHAVVVGNYLRIRGVSHLDALVSTHSHDDHLWGLSDALSVAVADTVYSPVSAYDSDAFRSFADKVKMQGKTITVPKVNDTFRLGSASVRILGPYSTTMGDNNSSIILRITYGKTSFLLMGDAESAEESALLKSGAVIKSDVLKTGHHGAEFSTEAGLLKAVAPKYAVISCGTGNMYGDPAPSVLQRLFASGVMTYRTDVNGTITCVSDGKNVRFVSSKGF